MRTTIGDDVVPGLAGGLARSEGDPVVLTDAEVALPVGDAAGPDIVFWQPASSSAVTNTSWRMIL